MLYIDTHQDIKRILQRVATTGRASTEKTQHGVQQRMPDIPKQIIKVSAEDGKRTVLLTGASGTGKTYQYGTLVRGGWRGLYADVEAKLPSINELEPELFCIRNPDFPLTPDQKSAMLRTDSSDLLTLVQLLKSSDHPYDFLYFDSMMRYSDHLLSFLRHTKGLTGYDLWGAFGEKMKTVLIAILGLTDPKLPKPVHVIATWGVEMGLDWRGRRMEQPLVDGKVVGPRIPYFFDDVIRLAKEEDAEDGTVEFLAYTSGTPEFVAKVSSGTSKLPAKITNPNLFNMITALTKPKPATPTVAKGS